MKKAHIFLVVLAALTTFTACSSETKTADNAETGAPTAELVETELEAETEVHENEVENEPEEAPAVVEPFDSTQLYKALEYNSSDNNYKISDNMYARIEYIKEKPELPEYGDYHLLAGGDTPIAGTNLCTFKNTSETETSGYNLAANDEYLFFCWYEGGQPNGYKSTITKVSLHDGWTESVTEIDHCNRLYGVYKDSLYMGYGDENGSCDLTIFKEETGEGQKLEFPETEEDLQIYEKTFDRYIVITGTADDAGLCTIYVVDMATGSVITVPEPGIKDTIAIENDVLSYIGQADSSIEYKLQ